MQNTKGQTVQYVDDNTDVFPMNRITAGHYQRKIGKTNFEAFRSDAEDVEVQFAGPPRWYGAVDGVIVTEGPNYRSVKIGMVEGGYVERAENNAEVIEKRNSARRAFEDVYGGKKLPPNVRKQLEHYGYTQDVLPKHLQH